LDNFLFGSFNTLGRIIAATPILYCTLILFVRLSGKRSTSDMNNFDWIVTVAMGSIIGSGILVKEVGLAEALVAIALLLLLQYGATRAMLDSATARRLIKAEPRLLVSRGQYLPAAMRKERITEGEVLAAIRESGMFDLNQVRAVVLESDATLSVIPRDQGAPEQEVLFSLPEDLMN